MIRSDGAVVLEGRRPVLAAAMCVLACLALLAGSPAASASPGSSGGRGSHEAAAAPNPCSGTGRTGLYQAASSRPTWLYVPRGATGPQRRPVVYLLHGSGQNGLDMLDPRTGTQLQRTADKYRFIIVAPSGGISLPRDQDPGPDFNWNIPGFAGGGDSDDGYLSSLVAYLPQALCADPARTFMTGFSGGARMTSQFGCRHRDQIGAIAPVSGLRAGAPEEVGDGTFRPGECLDTGSGRPPLPVIAFHGTADPVNYYNGDPAGSGSNRWGYGVPTALSRWGTINRCTRPRGSDAPAEVRYASAPAVTVLYYADCAGGTTTQLIRITNGAHVWPTAQGLNANELIWSTFAAAPPR